jgi:hypothetical protein
VPPATDPLPPQDSDTDTAGEGRSGGGTTVTGT